MDKSVIIFILFAVGFAAAVVGVVLFLAARRLPAAVAANKLVYIARSLKATRGEGGDYFAEYDNRGVRLDLSNDGGSGHLHIAIEPVRGLAGWRLNQQAGGGWEITSPQPSVADALWAAGLEGYLAPLRDYDDLYLDYQPGVLTLHCVYRLPNPYAVPDPDQFGEQLRALATIAHLNEQANPNLDQQGHVEWS